MIAALVDRVLHYRRCRRSRHVRLLPEARIVNMRGDPALIELGAHSAIRGELLVFHHGGWIRVGSWRYVGEGSRPWLASEMVGGYRALIAHGCSIFDNLPHPCRPRRGMRRRGTSRVALPCRTAGGRGASPRPAARMAIRSRRSRPPSGRRGLRDGGAGPVISS